MSSPFFGTCYGLCRRDCRFKVASHRFGLGDLFITPALKASARIRCLFVVQQLVLQTIG